MKNFYALLILMILGFSGYSQNVGINSTGTAPNAAAGLDVDFANKGVLIPRVALTGTANLAPLPAHVAGMVVYNTATAGDVIPGFYYNNGTKWVPGFLSATAPGNMIYWNGTAWVALAPGASGQYLQLDGSSVPFWGGIIAANPAIITAAATAITGISATSGANISSDGGSPILTRGICWNTATGPTIANLKSTDAAGGIGTYVSNLTSLTPATPYFIRAYTINSKSVNYGNEVTFTTSPVLPTLTTTVASAITATTANSGGNITADGGAAITGRGIVYGISSNPTLPGGTNPGTQIPDLAPGLGSFVSNISGLIGATTYYVRAYAINSVGTIYGAQISFATPTPPLSLTTVAATSIGSATAVSGGIKNGSFAGYSNYQNYGIAYSTSPNSATPTKFPTDPGNYSTSIPLNPWVTNITGLAANTTYYIRAYLEVYPSGTGPWITIFGNELSFTTTGATAPIVGTTTAVSAITGSTANSGGTITSDGGSAITAKGVCWGTSPNPILGTNNFTSMGAGTGAFGSSITGLSGSTTYYVRAYATNIIGTSYSTTDQTFTTCVAAYKVGDFAGGGRVFYVNCDGSGLIAALGDQPTTAVWGCSGTSIVTSTVLGSGAANTAAILAGCTDRPIAASLASSCTDGGYNDWYLPSQAELGLLINSGYVYGVQVSYYCSSSQSSATYVSGYYYANNWQMSNLAKTGTQFNVRAIRSFAAQIPVGAPVITTNPVINLIGALAEGGGTVTSSITPIISQGLCWSTSANPTIASNKVSELIISPKGNPYFCSMTGLSIGTVYHVRAYATNSAGTSYGSDVLFTATAAYVGQIINIGAITPGGCNVFSIDITGLHGLMADGYGFSGTDWGCANTITGAIGTAIGTGKANTTAILANIMTGGCFSSNQFFAVQVAQQLGPDWYLPSKGEFDLLWTNQVAAGIDVATWATFPLWSSSEVDATHAWAFDGTTWVSTDLKTTQHYVWPIMSF